MYGAKKEHVIRGGKLPPSTRVAKRTIIANDTFHKVAWIGSRRVVNVNNQGEPQFNPPQKRWDVK